MTLSRRSAVALASGAALTLAFPEPDLAPVAWIALVPLLVALSPPTSLAAGAALGFVFGLGFFGTLLYWISLVGWVSWGALVVLQAAFFAPLGALLVLVSAAPSLALRVGGAACAWVAVEFARSVLPFGGFTWGQLAQSQHDVAWLLEAASLGGGWTVALLVVAVNAIGAEWWRGGRRTNAGLAALAATALLLGAPAALPEPERGEPARVAIVQGNVPRAIAEAGVAREAAILASHRELTRDLAGRPLDLVVWPESSIGIDIDRTASVRRAVTSAARAVGAPMIVGGTLDVDDDRYLVMAFEIAPDGTIADRYQKTHLVPFGEYVPGRDLLDWIPLLDQVPRDALPGARPAVFAAPYLPGPIAPVISFEGDFGPLVRQRVARGARLVVVATNTSTWGHTWASAQHVAMSQVRAAENGVWVIHAALSGISALVAPDGRVTASTPLWQATSLVGEVEVVDSVTLYARTGDWLVWLSLAVTIVVAGLGAVTTRRR